MMTVYSIVKVLDLILFNIEQCVTNASDWCSFCY